MLLVGLVLAQHISKRLPGKNSLDFKGRPMFLENTSKLLKLLGRVYVTSDSQVVLNEARKVGAIPIWRGKKLCGECPNIPVYQHALSKMNGVDGIIAVQANSPTVNFNLIAMTKSIMEMGVAEVMTCHTDRSIYGSIWAITKKKLLHYGDYYHPEPDVLVVDTSIDIHDFKDYQEALALVSEIPGSVDILKI